MEHTQAKADEKSEKPTATTTAAATATSSAGTHAAPKSPSTLAPEAAAAAADTQQRPSTPPSGKKGSSTEAAAAAGSEEVEIAAPSDGAEKAGESGDANNAAAGQWMYLDGVNPTQHGPLAESAMLKLLRIGTAHKEMMAWSQGMSEWQPLGQVSPLVTHGLQQ